jgi:phytoene dehydrogenase-like protein
MANDRVLIVGGGLAGLCCGLELQKRGVPFLILEATETAGGRVGTDEFEGFLLDHGFQVYLTAYPEGFETLDYPALDFRAFQPGALIRASGRFHRFADPWRNRSELISALQSRVGSLADKVRLFRLRNRLMARGVDAILAADNQTTLGYLREVGFSRRIIDTFFRPFLGGIMLDSSLQPSSRMFEFVFKMMAEGDTVVPAKGMRQIPDQLASRLPEGSIRFGSRVSAVNKSSVTLATGEQLSGSAVVVACEGPEASRLDRTIPVRRWRSVRCVYYEAPEPPIEGAWLVLNGNNQWPVNNLAVMSEVSKDYAPSGKALVSISSLGKPTQADEEVKIAVESQLERWFGKSVRSWRYLRSYAIPHAQPDSSGVPVGKIPTRTATGVFVAGDHLAMPSIHFAMLSGRLTAGAVANHLSGAEESLAGATV